MYASKIIIVILVKEFYNLIPAKKIERHFVY